MINGMVKLALDDTSDYLDENLDQDQKDSVDWDDWVFHEERCAANWFAGDFGIEIIED